MLLSCHDETAVRARACGLDRAQLLQLRSLLGERGRNSWAIGDALVGVYGRPPRASHHDGASEHLLALADELGCSAAGLSAARVTAAAWPPRERRMTVAFSVHRELAGRGERVALLDRFIAQCERARVTPSTLRLRDFLATTCPTPTRRGHVDPVVRVERAALRLDRDQLLALIERLTAALLAAPVAA